MTIGLKAERWLESRKLDIEDAVRLGLYTARRVQNGAGEPPNYVPDSNGDILVFPYMEGGVEVNAKYRGKPRPDGSKNLWQRAGGKKTFFNADILDDPALADGRAALVIVEGEPDCLAVLAAKYPWVVSVPDGAPPDRDERGRPLPAVPDHALGIDPTNDEKYGYIHNNWDRLQKIKRFVIFTDGDGPGNRLRDELVRRLGRVRCSFVSYVDDLKSKKPDANEVLIQHGALAVRSMIDCALPFPIKGIYKLSEFPVSERPPLYSSGFLRLNQPFSRGKCGLMLAPGFLMVVLGKPGSGKSTWTLQLAHNMASTYQWQIGIASFEVQPVPYVRDIMRTHYIGTPRNMWNDDQRAEADAFIDKNYTFFYIDPRVDESEQSLDWLLLKAAEAVVRDGIRMLVIDPWNELEHARRPEETETQYTARAIRALKKFAMSYDVLVCVVIHPTKIGGEKKSEDLSLYHAEGSAHWVNKPDIGIVIERAKGDDDSMAIVHGRKFRFSFLGQCGSTDFVFDKSLETFSM